MDTGQVPLRQHDAVMPVILLTEGKGRAPGKQAVQHQQHGQAREPGLEACRQAVEGLQLTILFGGVGARVLDELALQGEDQPGGGD